MSREPLIPAALTGGPFTLEDARRHGLDLWHLRGKSWKRLGPAVYIWAGLPADPMQQLEAAYRRLPRSAVFSGLTAAWLHGLDVSPCNPIEVTVPPDAGVSARCGILLHRSAISKEDVDRSRGLPAMRIERTLAEACRRTTLVEGVVVVDEALHRRRVRVGSLRSWIGANGGFHGLQLLRNVVEFAEAEAESPMESRLRMLLILGGLPRPRVQVSIHDKWGRFIGRPDLYYEHERLGIEYDGGTHRDSLAEDNRRQNRLLESGVRLLRFTAADVLRNPDSVLMQVRAMLSGSL